MFLEAKTTKNREQMVLKNMFFPTSIFRCLFVKLSDWGLILGGPGAPKITKNRNKSRTIRFGGQFGTHLFLECPSGRVLGGFGDGFGRVWGGFREDLGKTLKGFWKGFVGGFWKCFWEGLGRLGTNSD